MRTIFPALCLAVVYFGIVLHLPAAIRRWRQRRRDRRDRRAKPLPTPLPTLDWKPLPSISGFTPEQAKKLHGDMPELHKWLNGQFGPTAELQIESDGYSPYAWIPVPDAGSVYPDVVKVDHAKRRRVVGLRMPAGGWLFYRCDDLDNAAGKLEAAIAQDVARGLIGEIDAARLRAGLIRVPPGE